MIAYNPTDLDNVTIIEAAQEALDEQCISTAEYERIVTGYPYRFYTPNAFIRIGLFIVTVIVVLFSFGLFCLMFSSFQSATFGTLALLFGIITYAVLELLIVREKRHYHSGVDDALLWMSGIFFVGSICIFREGNVSPLLLCSLLLATTAFFTLRFADMLMGILALLSLLGVIFYTCVQAGAAGKTIAPFALMVASYAVYGGMRGLVNKKAARHYTLCMNLVSVVALVTGYLAVNYFVVRELSNELFSLHLQAGDRFPAGWLFWLFTVAIPPLYLFLGIRKKDRVLICTGLLLIAAIAFTIRYYHSVAPLEVMMVVCGIALTGIAYGLIRYLKPPRQGFTSEPGRGANKREMLQLESIVLAQTFSEAPAPDHSFDFGGGSGGGAGASGNY